MKSRRPAKVILRRGDASSLLRSLPPGSIDVLITDPPYSTVDRHSSPGSHLRRWFAGTLTWRKIAPILALARTKLAKDGVAFVMTNQAGLEDALHAMRTAGFEEPFRVIAWDKRVPGLGGGLRHQVEYILVGRVPGSRTLTGSDLISVSAVGPNTAHRYPTQKPDELGRLLAKMARVTRGDTVVDPFCGSGALLVGSAERGGTVIGSDTSARAIALARARLSQATARRPSPAANGGGKGRPTKAAESRGGRTRAAGRPTRHVRRRVPARRAR